jgi:bidirectional [NiFe] hydrogenase diaphorase subunit
VPTVVLDGRPVPVQAGRTVLEACREHGVALPTLCHLDGLPEVSSCRLCLVEVKGFPRPIAACSTRIWDGMEIATATERLVRHRRGVIELLLSSGEHVCAYCPSSGRCALQDLAHALGVDHHDVREARRAPPLDASRARFALDPGRCVLCTRCVRVCAEVEGARTLHLSGRGARTRVVTDGGPWGASPTCTDCGKCVAACPTGALLEKAAAAQGLAIAARPPSAPAAPGVEPGPPAHAGGARARVATLWLGGCSGCHMSLLDLDEGLLELASRMDLVYSPLADARELPDGVDVCLVEGAVATSAQLDLLRRARERSRVLVALGDCATSGNVTGMRDAAGGAGAVEHASWTRAARDPALPALLGRVLPLHAVVAVDAFLPGCPPPAEGIGRALSRLLAGGARAPRSG